MTIVIRRICKANCLIFSHTLPMLQHRQGDESPGGRTIPTLEAFSVDVTSMDVP